jgi:hypothetical protein
MQRLSRLLPALIVLGAVTGCGSSRYSNAAFRLPPGGDAERGKQTFVALGCNSCHAVVGTDLPQPTVQPMVPVVLGGEVTQRPADAYLVTSVICPSCRLAPYPKNQITENGVSRMPRDYAERITVAQLADIVAFLQSHYTLRRLPEYTYR